MGGACNCSQVLRNLGLQVESFPFDWAASRNQFGGFEERANLILNKFYHYLEFEDLEELPPSNPHQGHLHIFNRYTKFIYPHDFNIGELADAYPETKSTFDRRAERLLRRLDESRKTLFVYMPNIFGTPQNDKAIPDELVLSVMDRLRTAYPNKRLDLMLFECDLAKKEGEIVRKFIAPGIVRHTSNHAIVGERLQFEGGVFPFVKSIHLVLGKIKLSDRIYLGNN
jgi:hypothetical protein